MNTWAFHWIHARLTALSEGDTVLLLHFVVKQAKQEQLLDRPMAATQHLRAGEERAWQEQVISKFAKQKDLHSILGKAREQLDGSKTVGQVDLELRAIEFYPTVALGSP